VEVKPGYKLTEVGLIPERWEVIGLPEVVWYQEGPGVRNYQFTTSGVKLFNGSNIENGKIDLTKTDRYISEHEAYGWYAHFLADAGDIVIACSGISVDRFEEKVAVLGAEHLPLCMNTSTMRFKTKSSHVCQSYFMHYLRSNLFKEQISGKATGSAQLNFGPAHVALVELLLPPLAEQEAIAAALSDADTLIEALEQLIAKKRQVKQGAMQELLQQKDTDEVRLLEEVSSLKGRIGWQGLKQTEFTTNEDEPFLITGMNFKDGAIRWDEVYHVSEERYEIAKDIQLRTGDVLMTKDGTIGKVLYIDEIPSPGKASLNSHLLLFRPIRESYHPKYLYCQLSSKRFTDFIELNKSGTTFFGISQAAVGKYPVLLPPIEEQEAIAAILSDMDAEIAALEEKLTKARQVKQGMMQELLTGRTRLIENG